MRSLSLLTLCIHCYHVYKDIREATVEKHLNHETKPSSLTTVATVVLMNGICADTQFTMDLAPQATEFQKR